MSKPMARRAETAHTRYQVRIAFEGMRVGDQFEMDAADPYVRGLLGAALIEPVTADASRLQESVDERHVASDVADASPQAQDDTSSPPAAATP